MFQFMAVIVNTLRYPVKDTQIQLLGRWKPTHTKQTQIKSYLADIDNCGIYNYKTIDRNMLYSPDRIACSEASC